MTLTSTEFETLNNNVRTIAKEIAAVHAASVDSEARFPAETVKALKEAKIISAAVPKEFGGPGLNMQQLGHICSTLSAACGSSGMVLAMHFNQLACLARHHSTDTSYGKCGNVELI